MLLLRWLLLIIYLDPVLSNFSCLDKPCSCCMRGKCEDPRLHLYPCDGCIKGFTGPSCLEPCPTNCKNCSQLFFEYDTEKVCFQCKAGFYNGQYRDIEYYPFQLDCSLACNTGCELCTSYNDCSKCKVGYLLSEGKECKECPPNCEHCQSEFSCLVCQDGYSWSGKVCQPCKPSCKRCKSSGECIECYSGFYERDNDCARCPLGCAKCSGPGICNDCLEGNYLVQGQCVECQDNCMACSLNSMSQYTCRTCRSGFFLSNNICLECEIGCISCKSKSDCLTCLSSYQLNDGQCYSCSPRCTSCSRHNNCTACESNYYIMDGHCHSCQKNCAICSSDKLCITCEHGFFGTDCSHVCQSNCANNICNKSTGQCTACRDGYYFDQSSCIKCPNHCSVCTSNSACLSCASGYKGITCEEKCTKCSLGTACDKSTGYCFEACADGLSGKRCNLPCDSKCLSCNRANPSKCSKCALDRYGAACLSKCSEKCANKACDDIESVCTDGCVAGFWGSRCERSCPENCKSSICERNSGACSAGCIANFKGDKCACMVNCKCDDNDICVRCLQGYGEKCDKKCGGGCADGTCDRISGECSHGCIHGFRGVSCSTSTERRVNVGLIIACAVSLLLLVLAILAIIFRSSIKILIVQKISSFCEWHRDSERTFYENSKPLTKQAQKEHVPVDIQYTEMQRLINETDNDEIKPLTSGRQSVTVSVNFCKNSREMKAANSDENVERGICLDNVNTDKSKDDTMHFQRTEGERCSTLVKSGSVPHTEVYARNVEEERAQPNKQNDELQTEICEIERFNDIHAVKSLSTQHTKYDSLPKKRNSATYRQRILPEGNLIMSSSNIQDTFMLLQCNVETSEIQTSNKTFRKSKSLNSLSLKPSIEERTKGLNQNLGDQKTIKLQKNNDTGHNGHVTYKITNEDSDDEEYCLAPESNPSTPDAKPPEEIVNTLLSSKMQSYSQNQPARSETAEGNQETPSDMRPSSRDHHADNEIGDDNNDTQLKEANITSSDVSIAKMDGPDNSGSAYVIIPPTDYEHNAEGSGNDGLLLSSGQAKENNNIEKDVKERRLSQTLPSSIKDDENSTNAEHISPDTDEEYEEPPRNEEEEEDTTSKEALKTTIPDKEKDSSNFKGDAKSSCPIKHENKSKSVENAEPSSNGQHGEHKTGEDDLDSQSEFEDD